MIVAVVLAGGKGQRMDSEIPKQFINVYDKPILMYTLEAFEKHPQIDAIEVVAIDGWEGLVWAYAKQFNISKLKWVVSGGNSVQESIRNGLLNIENEVSGDDVVLIHDGIRPLVDQDVLTDVIKVANDKGNAVSSMPYNEQIFVIDSDNEETTKEYVVRETIRRVSTPQAYNATMIIDLYKKAFTDGKGIFGSSYADTLMTEYGRSVFYSMGSDKNIKIIDQDDLNLFKAFLQKENANWLK
jgi:2-C-methyl-D-erythritol 4-phosphate cytidylyltransferase